MRELSIDEVLTTTRAVRKRLDFDRAVPRSVVETCLELAFQAPNGSNMNAWHWVVVDDPDVIAEMARLYNQGLDDFIETLGGATGDAYMGAHIPGYEHIATSTDYLREHIHRAPVLVLPLMGGRTDGANLFFQASQFGSILQATWSLMLALRARGLGSCWTTGHLWREREMAELLGVPFERHAQVGLFPVAYTLGTDFKAAWRKPVSDVVSWNHFGQ